MIERRAFLASLAVAGVAGSVGTAFAADTLQEIKSKGVLRVGVKADYPPYGFRAPNGDIIGIEPDLARDVAKRLGVKLDLIPVETSNRIQFLQQGRIDLMIATMNVTPEREKLVDIVKPYYYASGYSLMLPKSLHITSWSEVKGKPMCAVQGAFYNKGASEKFGIHTVAFTGITAALTAMKQGRCVGFVYDNTLIDGQLLKPEWKDYEMPLSVQDPQPWGIAVRNGDTQFADFMSKTIKDWAKTGLILKLETKYGIAHHSEFAEAEHKKYE